MNDHKPCNHGDINKIRFIGVALSILHMTNDGQCLIDLMTNALKNVQCTEEEKIAGILMFFVLREENPLNRAMTLAVTMIEYRQHPINGVESLFLQVEAAELIQESVIKDKFGKSIEDMLNDDNSTLDDGQG